MSFYKPINSIFFTKTMTKTNAIIEYVFERDKINVKPHLHQRSNTLLAVLNLIYCPIEKKTSHFLFYIYLLISI